MIPRTLSLLILSVTLLAPHSAWAQDGGKTGVVAVDQHGLAVNDVCYVAIAVDHPNDHPQVSACDKDDGAIDGTTILAEIPLGVRYELLVSVMPGPCTDDPPYEFSQADATLVIVHLVCLYDTATTLPATGVGPQLSSSSTAGDPAIWALASTGFLLSLAALSRLRVVRVRLGF